jgi:Tfp pilus assembly protein PilF
MKRSKPFIAATLAAVCILMGGLEEGRAATNLQVAVGWRSYLENSDTDNATARWNQALKEHPDEPLASVGLALVAEERGNTAEALGHYRTALLGSAEVLFHSEAQSPGEKIF